MNERPRLRKIELEGPYAWVRNTWFFMVMALSTIGSIGYVIPGHIVNHHDLHSNFADGGPWALIVFGVVFAAAALLRQYKLGAGMLTGVLASAGAIASVVPMVLVHFLSEVQSSIGDHLFGVAVIGLFFGGLLMVIAEPLIYVAQRRSLERSQLPRIPAARIA
jgi:hypothetical protein